MGGAVAHRPPFRIGLTGGVASGKSTVAQRFLQLGVAVIDADEIARDVVTPGQPALAMIVRRFGPGIVDAHGALERRALRSIIFADSAARADLEAILHPPIRAEMDRLVAAATAPYVMLSIPLLVEGGNPRARVDRILVVDTDEGHQLARVRARDGIGETEARAMIAAQASRAERLRAADDVLPNVADLAHLHAAVDRLHAQYLAFAAARRE